MSKFRLINHPTKEEADQAWIFSDEYFTVDTVSRELSDTWYQKNGRNMIYAMQDDEVVAFFNIIPLTQEAGVLFEESRIREEDITTDHILPPETMRYARSIYIAGIAIKYRQTIPGNQCLAALIAGLCQRICEDYNPEYLTTIFANPTTFDGNRFTKRLGFGPVSQHKRSLRAGNDIYGLSVTPKLFSELCSLQKRYDRFVEKYDWRD